MYIKHFPQSWVGNVKVKRKLGLRFCSLILLCALLRPYAAKKVKFLKLLSAPEASSQAALGYEKFLYIYEVPSQFTYDLLSLDKFELAPGTKYSQWQSEYYLHQLLMRSSYVTHDPERATFFFVPLYGSGMRLLSSAERMNIWEGITSWLRLQKSKSKASYFERNAGLDHAFAFGASRSWCKVSSASQKTPKCLGLSHNILFDSNFIKLSVEFTGLRQEHFEKRSMQEKLSRIMIIPYMHFDFKSAFDFQFFETDFPLPPTGKRENLLYFSGSILPKTAPFRSIFRDACDKFPKCSFDELRRRSFNVSQQMSGLRQSTFCAILGGDTRASKRLFDAITSLCIPVIFDPLLVMPFMDSVPYHEFVIRAPFIRSKIIVEDVLRKLQDIPEYEIIQRQSSMNVYKSYVSYLSSSRPNAIDMIIKRLYVRGQAIRNEYPNRANITKLGLQDWKHAGSLCGIPGASGASACKVYTQNIL